MATAYRRTRGTTSRTPRARWLELRRADRCALCAVELPAGTRAYWDGYRREVLCASPEHTSTIESREADPFRMTAGRGYTGRGRGRCEDAPCCGCC